MSSAKENKKKVKMPSSFDRAVDVVFDQEGFESNDPADPGGKTRLGITAVSLAAAKADGVVRQDLELGDLNREHAKTIYKALYWDKISADSMPLDFGLVLFDSAVNMGVSQAVKTAQKALGVTEDGVVGPKTLEAIRNAGDVGLDRALATRVLFYVDLAAQRPSLQGFRLGWLRRCFTVGRLAVGAK